MSQPTRNDVIQQLAKAYSKKLLPNSDNPNEVNIIKGKLKSAVQNAKSSCEKNLHDKINKFDDYEDKQDDELYAMVVEEATRAIKLELQKSIINEQNDQAKTVGKTGTHQKTSQSRKSSGSARNQSGGSTSRNSPRNSRHTEKSAVAQNNVQTFMAVYAVQSGQLKTPERKRGGTNEKGETVPKSRNHGDTTPVTTDTKLKSALKRSPTELVGKNVTEKLQAPNATEKQTQKVSVGSQNVVTSIQTNKKVEHTNNQKPLVQDEPQKTHLSHQKGSVKTEKVEIKKVDEKIDNKTIEKNDEVPQKGGMDALVTQNADEFPVTSYALLPSSMLQQLTTSEMDKLRKISETVDRAVSSGKVFNAINNYIVCRLLYTRGWVEKLYTSKDSHEVQQNAEKMPIHQLLVKSNDNTNSYIYGRMLRSKLIKSEYLCDFFWNSKPGNFSVLDTVQKPVYVNHFQKRGEHDFCSKIGLYENLKNLKGTEVCYPRTFILHGGLEMDLFIDDFRLTACLSMLKWFMDKSSLPDTTLVSAQGRIPIEAFYFAIYHAISFIRKKEKDQGTECKKYPLDTWNKFIDHYFYCVFGDHHFYMSRNTNEERSFQTHVDEMKRKADFVLKQVQKYRPEIVWDGINNLWILKPDRRSRGIGIVVCRRFCDIKELVTTNTHLNYIAQKYIEKPLLIYNTKFDIRQWVLMSNSPSLTIWIYKKCYLRFSSQEFDLKKLHEAVHLTNNSVQSKYQKSPKLELIPSDKMWDLQAFQDYLKNIGHATAWNDITFPRIKQALLAVLLPASEQMDRRANTYEVYGVDFMMTPDFQPWLIEINSHPALGHTTSVTSKLCPIMLEDLLKVVLDYSKNPEMPTGDYELIYQAKDSPQPNQSPT